MKEEKNPWTVLTSKEVLNNAWIKVTHNEVINPNGNKGIYGTVHFHNIAIGIIPIDNEGNTWIIGQYRFPIKEYTWEIPEGGGPLDVSPLESAKRELKEEAGIIAKKYIEIQRIHLSNSVTDELGIIYVATHLSFTEKCPDDTEILQVKKIPLNEAFRMVHNGKITDSPSVTGLLKLEVMLMKGELEI